MNWFDSIRENLEKANVLLFLFTSSNTSWDWPLYEVGLATNLKNLDDCKIITLYPPGSNPPDPVKHIQAVETDVQGVKDFLIKFFTTSELTGVEPFLNSKITNDNESLDRVSREISNHFKSISTWENCFTNYLWVIVANGVVETQNIPPDSYIDSKSTALRMFGLSDRPPAEDFWTWQQILDTLDQRDIDTWVSELGDRFYHASRGSQLRATTSTYMCKATDKLHRPLLHKVILRKDGSMLFEVIFVRHYDIGDS